MPLTKSGKRIIRTFEREYGKVKGKRVFYEFMRSHPRHTSRWHKK